MPTDKFGNKLTWKEFFSRWKKGVESITPQQKVKSEITGTFIILLGLCFSLFAVIWFREKIGLLAYGLILIFVGNIVTTGLKWIALRQQKKLFDNLEEQFKEVK